MKHAYFVRDGDWLGLRRAIQQACTQWGGIRILVIPVDPHVDRLDSFSEHMLRLHDPDRFVDYAHERTDHDGRQELSTLLARIFSDRRVALQESSAYERFDQTIHALWSVPPEILQRELLRIYRLGGAADEAAILAAIVGEPFPRQERVIGP